MASRHQRLVATVAERSSNAAVDEAREGSIAGTETAAVDERARFAAVHAAAVELQAKARHAQVVKAPEVLRSEPVEVSGPKTGIAHTHQGPFPASFFQVEDSWTGRIGDGFIVVYAGAELNAASERDQVTHGGVRVYSEPASLTSGKAPTLVGAFRAPNGAEPVTVISDSNDELTLRGTQGVTLTFNTTTDNYGVLQK